MGMCLLRDIFDRDEDVCVFVYDYVAKGAKCAVSRAERWVIYGERRKESKRSRQSKQKETYTWASSHH